MICGYEIDALREDERRLRTHAMYTQSESIADLLTAAADRVREAIKIIEREMQE